MLGQWQKELVGDPQVHPQAASEIVVRTASWSAANYSPLVSICVELHRCKCRSRSTCRCTVSQPPSSRQPYPAWTT